VALRVSTGCAIPPQPVFYVGGLPFIPALHLQTFRPV